MCTGCLYLSPIGLVNNVSACMTSIIIHDEVSTRKNLTGLTLREYLRLSLNSVNRILELLVRAQGLASRLETPVNVMVLLT